MQGRGAVGLRCNPLLCHHQCPHRYYIGKQRGGAVRHWRLEPDSMRGWLLRRGWLRGGAPGATWGRAAGGAYVLSKWRPTSANNA